MFFMSKDVSPGYSSLSFLSRIPAAFKYLCNPVQSCTPAAAAAAAAAAAKSLQWCPTLCNPNDGSPSGSTVPGILQARALEWVAISFSNA